MRPKERVDVHEFPSGDIHLFLRGRPANFRLADEGSKATASLPETLTA